MRNSVRLVFPGVRRLLWLACLCMAGGLSACAAGTAAGGGPFPRFAEYEGDEVRRVRFAGDLVVPRDSLEAIITTRATECRLFGILPVCLFGLGENEYDLDLEELARDVLRIQLYYRDHGFYGTRVVPSVEPVDENAVAVRIAVAPGDRVILRELEVEGTDTILEGRRLRAALPLEVGTPFRRTEFLQSADTLRSLLLQRGYAYADVLRNYSIDTIADVASVQLVAIPGPRVYVDSVVVLGNARLSDGTLRQQITLSEGELLRVPELVRSQRNLYALDMVEFAAVNIVPDTSDVPDAPADSARAKVVARVAEAAQYLVDAALGFGTVDCVRTQGRWVNRNFLGGGRRLEVTGQLSRIGASEPLDIGLSPGLCDDLRFGAGDAVNPLEAELQEAAEKLNYRASVSFQQPRVLNTRNQLGAQVHAERLVELSAFVRESVGAQVGLVRPLDARTVLSTQAEVQHGRTLARPVVLCISLETCTQEDLDVLTQGRWSNFLAASAVRELALAPGVRRYGYSVRGGVDWASSVFGSDNEYLRTITEGSYYRQLRPGWILAGNLRLGRFFAGSLAPQGGYIPPERRFYAGGPNSVRGYQRNSLGPTAYVVQPPEEGEDERKPIATAIGGTQVVLGSVELRFPSPYFSDLLRLAAFVDGGQVTVPGEEEFGGGGFRVTPGVGLRFITPVGPFRLDLAYRPYPPPVGRLYELRDEGLVLLDPRFQLEEGDGFWSKLSDRLQVNLAFGQPF